MNIDTQLFVLSGGLAVLSLVAAWQAWRLRNIYRSGSSMVGVAAFVMMGARQVYSFLRLRSNIAQARSQGTMVEHLSTEQWIVGVGWAYLIMLCFIWWQHWKHLDLKRLGI